MAKILIADDQKILREILKDMLAKNGYADLLEAADGTDAYDLYFKEKPDLVLMDIVMPKSGMTAISDILAKDPKAKIIAVSMIGAQITVSKAMQLGAIDYLTKPLTEERVIGAVKKALGETGEPAIGAAKTTL